MIDEWVHLIANEEVADEFFLARLAAPEIASRAEPGQFVELRVRGGENGLLRLPLSICSADPQGGTVDLLYECVGPKTQALSRMREEEETVCLGPLGRGFAAPDAGNRALLVGGGIGIPPLLFWGMRLRELGVETVLLAGARTAGKHLADEILGVAGRVRRASDDGSLGHGGLVTELLEEELEKGEKGTVYTCGPHGMMAAVAALCRHHDLPCQASLEEYMACGIGICVGCVVEMLPGEGEGASAYERYRRVCVDGPVFDARRVKWGA